MKIIKHPISAQTHTVYVRSKPGGSTVDRRGNLQNVQPDGIQKKSGPPYTVCITGCGLNIRYGPGTHFSVVRIARGGEIFTVVEEAFGIGASKWGRVESGEGWISLDFVRCKQ